MPNVEHLRDTLNYDELVYVLSHDLQAPSRNLRQYVYMLQQETQDAELTPMAEKFIGRLTDVLDRMDTQLAALLTLSRFGRASGSMADVDVAPLVERAMADRGLEGTVSQDMPGIQADYERVEWLFHQLLDNVVHHGGEGATVSVSYEDGQYWIRDTGLGIAPRVRHEVFTIYRPVQRPDSERKGIGLPCVSRIMRSLGGSIGIDCPSDGGAHVWLKFPS